MEIKFWILIIVTFVLLFRKQIYKIIVKGFIKKDEHIKDNLDDKFSKEEIKKNKEKKYQDILSELDSSDGDTVKVDFEHAMFLLRNYSSRSVISEDGKVFIGGIQKDRDFKSNDDIEQKENVQQLLKEVDEAADQYIVQRKENGDNVIQIKDSDGGIDEFIISQGKISKAYNDKEKKRPNNQNNFSSIDDKINDKVEEAFLSKSKNHDRDEELKLDSESINISEMSYPNITREENVSTENVQSISNSNQKLVLPSDFSNMYSKHNEKTIDKNIDNVDNTPLEMPESHKSISNEKVNEENINDSTSDTISDKDFSFVSKDSSINDTPTNYDENISSLFENSKNKIHKEKLKILNPKHKSSKNKKSEEVSDEDVELLNAISVEKNNYETFLEEDLFNFFEDKEKSLNFFEEMISHLSSNNSVKNINEEIYIDAENIVKYLIRDIPNNLDIVDRDYILEDNEQVGRILFHINLASQKNGIIHFSVHNNKEKYIYGKKIDNGSGSSSKYVKTKLSEELKKHLNI